MKRIAIIGGGISGLTAAYECQKLGLDWHLYEATDRLGGIIETTRIDTPEGRYILEGGPDGWVSEKPWATELAKELGLEDQLIYSNDDTRKTWILLNGKLQAIPDGMRMMVPTDLSALDNSPLFSAAAKAAYAAEPSRAAELKASAPDFDESVASFVRRHFGDEVLTTLAAPLLSGVFGGDVHKLSVRAVMPQFVKMEREHGSLILALQSKQNEAQSKPIFTSLRNGIATLTEALASRLPADRLRIVNSEIRLMDDAGWHVLVGQPDRSYLGGLFTKFKVTRSENDYIDSVDHLIFATPLDVIRGFLPGLVNISAAALIPTHASSATLVAMTWPANVANTFFVPEGFGFLVPPTTSKDCHPERSEGPASRPNHHEPQLLACTFVDQKFPHRAPKNTRILRAFFGGASADALAQSTDAEIAKAALAELRNILGPIPTPEHTHIRRLPRSLPQYEVGHLDRMAQLASLVAEIPGLTLLGNAYQGVGLPDLIREARSAVRKLA